MLPTNNVFSPASGEPIITPSLDIVLDCYFLTNLPEESEEDENLKCFSNYDEVLIAFAL